MLLKITFLRILVILCVPKTLIFSNASVLSNVKLLLAVNAQNMDEIMNAINEGASVNAKVGGLFPLHLAITVANTEIVELLLLLGASIHNKVRLDNNVFNAIELARWYVKACSSTLKETQLIKRDRLKSQESDDIDFIEYVCKECNNRLKEYKCLVKILKSYTKLLQNNLNKVRFDFCYKF